MSTEVEQLEWRRSKVVEMRARCLSQTEIAHELQVSKASITSDVQYIRQQAKGTIKEYATDHLPEQQTHLDKESNWLRRIIVYAPLYGVALFEG